MSNDPKVNIILDFNDLGDFEMSHDPDPEVNDQAMVCLTSNLGIRPPNLGYNFLYKAMVCLFHCKK